MRLVLATGWYQRHQWYHIRFSEGLWNRTRMSSTFDQVPGESAFQFPQANTKGPWSFCCSSLKLYCLVQVLLKISASLFNCKLGQAILHHVFDQIAKILDCDILKVCSCSCKNRVND